MCFKEVNCPQEGKASAVSVLAYGAGWVEGKKPTHQTKQKKPTLNDLKTHTDWSKILNNLELHCGIWRHPEHTGLLERLLFPCSWSLLLSLLSKKIVCSSDWFCVTGAELHLCHSYRVTSCLVNKWKVYTATLARIFKYLLKGKESLQKQSTAIITIVSIQWNSWKPGPWRSSPPERSRERMRKWAILGRHCWGLKCGFQTPFIFVPFRTA